MSTPGSSPRTPAEHRGDSPPAPADGAVGAARRGAPVAGIVPGEVLFGDGRVPAVQGTTGSLAVVNSGDRPVQIGSHFHFAEVNEALLFDRLAAWGKRLAIPAGTAVRFEPGIEREVLVVALAGRRTVHGLRGLVRGSLDARSPGAGSLDAGGTGSRAAEGPVVGA